MEGSNFLHHEPCPECGSSDALSRYDDEHGYCFACEKYFAGEDSEAKPRRRTLPSDLIKPGKVKQLSKRKISADTCRKFGYTIDKLRGRPVHIAEYRDKKGEVCAQHIRFPDKDFIWKGDAKQAVLFGQHLWRDGGKMLIITEGEIDAMSLSQIQGNKWPVVSIQTGAPSATKAIKRSLEWIESYEKVVFAFDMDDVGREAAKKCAVLLSPGKAYIAHLPMKDANDSLVNGKSKELMAAIWEAKPFRPDGIVTLADVKEKAKLPVLEGAPWPWETLTKLTYGRRIGEVYCLGAGTGVGKTDVFTQCIAHDVTVLKIPVGLFYLEQPPVETVKRLAGKSAGKRFHVPDADWSQDELDKAIDDLDSSGKVYLYDHFGSTDWEVIKSSMRFMAVAHDVRHIYLDHLTALAAHADDERKALEALMAEIAGMAQELGIVIHMISHLATPEGKPHEEGGRVMIRHFKGSRAIGYWSHFMFGLERNQQAENEAERHTTAFRVLKDRYTGQAAGNVIYLHYDSDTGRLVETDPPDPSTPFDQGATDEGGSDY